MKIPLKYTITNKSLTYISLIEAYKTEFKSFKIPEEIFINLKHQSLLKSSVFSAQIEGNTLTADEIERNTHENTEKQFERQEIENIIRSLSFLRDRNIPDTIDVPFILQLHKLIMNKLVHESQTGTLRKDPSAIFDANGLVVYMTPPPSKIDDLLLDLLHVINDNLGIFPLIKAPLVHICFEKIHPFMDGNGRVGRLLTQALIAKHNYHFNWLLSIEELLQEKKQTYYSLLDQPDATGFIEFFLEVFVEEIERLKKNIQTVENPKKEDFLLPRRKEILQIIKEQKIIPFDSIQRRFIKIPARTLRYDLKQLQIQGFIQKIGTTRGAMYQIK